MAGSSAGAAHIREGIEMAGFGVPELLIILVIVVILFGASRLAGVGSALGTSVREFKKGIREEPPGPEKQT